MRGQRENHIEAPQFYGYCKGFKFAEDLIRRFEETSRDPTA